MPAFVAKLDGGFVLPARDRPVTLADLTRCTVAVFAHNEQRNIAKTVLSIIHQNLPPSVEIAELLVVASNCTDQTLDILEAMTQDYPRLTIIREEKRSGKAHAVNLALRQAVGDVIFLVPGDVVLQPEAISNLCSTLQDRRVGVACGRACPVNSTDTIADRISLLLWNLHNRTMKSLNEDNVSTHACGEFMALKNGVVDYVDEDIVNDDAYIALMAWSRGFRVAYNDAASVWMKAPSTFCEILQQRTRILVGHRLIKRRLGHFPRTLTTMLLYDPTRVIRIFTNQIVEQPSQVLTLIVACYLEALANALATFVQFSRTDLRRWRTVESTKDLGTLGPYAEARTAVDRM